jgi:catechol 2,3-dioxygenase-like lactoylglutathione lyase family enzyme
MAVVLDHVHLVVSDPRAAAAWFAQMLDGVVVGQATVLGAPQAYVRFGEGLVIVRSLRQGETLGARDGRRLPVDHFGLRVDGDLDGLCDRLRASGVRFLLDPVDINPATRVAFVEGPDAMAIELTERREWPDLVTLGADGTRAQSTPP